MLKYDFDRGKELAWFALTAAGTFLLVLAADFDMDTITDWRAYGIAALSGAIRAGAAAVLARMGR